MSFEHDLRLRLRDIADQEAPWPDPTEAARDRATQTKTVADDTDASEELAARRRREWRHLPGTVAAAVLLAAIVGGISYVVVDNSGGEMASSSAAGAAAPEGVSGDMASDNAPTLQTCGTVPTESTGPLAAIATLSAPTIARETGIIQTPTEPPGFQVYDANSTLSLATNGPLLFMPNSWIYVLRDGTMVNAPQQRTGLFDDSEPVPLAAGTTPIGSTFQPLRCDNTSLPFGTYQVVVVYDYSVFDDPTHADYQLVSPPTTWTFS